MSKGTELGTTTKLVKSILEEFPPARNSDMVLYIKVCEKLNPEALCKPFWYILSSLSDHKLPCIETVRRTRQKLQATFSELAADADVEAQRMVNEEFFKDYARGILK